jgi:para-aminobenzoate synthetase
VLTLRDIFHGMPADSQPGVPSLALRHLDWMSEPESVFVHLFGESRNAFWLDSSALGERGRFSFMGDSEGPLGSVVTYDVDLGEVRVARQGGVEMRAESIFTYLGGEMARLRPCGLDLPFDFDCGFVGYLGYELKVECDGPIEHSATTPDAAFVFADRLIAFDHRERHTYLLSLTEADPWIEATERRLADLQAPVEPQAVALPPLSARRSQRRYREDIEACKRYLNAGHSYEICLTNALDCETDADPLDLYRALRRANPAPFASYLRFGDVAVLSSSPERFLSVDRDARVESRPIKGTNRRGATPAEDARLAGELRDGTKSRAENVTIVDLMRNDLGRVCALGSIEVPEMMRIESFETVHQLVSSVCGRLRPELTSIDAVRACFPPGSMTGAPKRRTMEIIDELEGSARGIYSGAVGWVGLGGACDFSVAIRTIVLEGERASVGAGGAIVLDSDPTQELEEMLLKARASIAAFKCGSALIGRT